MKKKVQNQADFSAIVRAIEDYVFDKHKVCGLDEISTLTGISKKRCSEVLSILIGQKQIYEIFSGNGKPTLYIPYDMMQGVLTLQAKPQWLANFHNKEKKELISKRESISKDISKHEMLERLLYATDKPLEEAVAFALNLLEFSKVNHLNDDERHDIECSFGGHEYILEVKGKGNTADKENVLQLRGWTDKKIEEGSKSDKLIGMLVVNHFRYDEPKDRKNPLTEKAIEYMKINNFRLITTPFLYNIVQEVISGKKSKEDARKMISSGESYGGNN